MQSGCISKGTDTKCAKAAQESTIAIHLEGVGLSYVLLEYTGARQIVIFGGVDHQACFAACQQQHATHDPLDMLLWLSLACCLGLLGALLPDTEL